MKRLFAALILTAAISLGLGHAKASDSWKINTFHSDINILQSGQVDITEKITVTFSSSKHGIYRTIPISYNDKNSKVLYTSLRVVDVSQDNDSAIYSTTNDSANETIKIGDPNNTITGSHSYIIHYIVDGVLSSYSDNDEFYWNVTGDAWAVNIDTASATVKLPVNGIKQYSCYQGISGSTEKCQTPTVDKTTASFSASRVLNSSEGLTVAVGYTKGLFPINVISKPTGTSISITSLLAQFITTFILGLAGIISYTVFLKRKTEKSIEAKVAANAPVNLATIAVEYEAPFGLRPGQVGGVIDEKVDTLDITATIVDLAIRGYLTITEQPKTWALGEKDYLLTATSLSMDDLKSYEQLLLSKLFKGRSEVKMSQLRNTFYQDLAEIKDELYQDLVTNGYFITNPQTINKIYYGITIALVVIGGSAIGIGLYGIGVALILCGLLAALMKRIIPERSLLGRQAVQKILGYKLFVSATEKYRQPYLEKQNMYMEVLPYAIVFGVTDQLANAFKEMGITPPQPNWYISNQPFVAFAFASEMNSFSNQLSSTIASAPSGSGSSGSGFSGGGFGGGGGGSW